MDNSLGDVGKTKRAALIIILKYAGLRLGKYQVNLTELLRKYEILGLIKYEKMYRFSILHGSTHHTAGKAAYQNDT